MTSHLLRKLSLFERLLVAGLTVNMAKYEFAKATIAYLGRVVGQDTVRPVHAKVLAVQQYPAPLTKKELMRKRISSFFFGRVLPQCL